MRVVTGQLVRAWVGAAVLFPRFSRCFFALREGERMMALVGNFMSYLRIKLETKNVTPDTTFRFNSKEI
jgi:hypothetical protein